MLVRLGGDHRTAKGGASTRLEVLSPEISFAIASSLSSVISPISWRDSREGLTPAT